MKRILMCPPRYYDVCYVINPWMQGNLGKVDKQQAQRQWQQLHGIVSKLAQVRLVEPVEGLPDMVFTANAGLVRGNKVIVSSFLHAERQPEAQHFDKYFSSQGYRVYHLQQGTIFEGAGDALFDASGRLWLGSGVRSDAHALHGIKAVFDVDVHALELINPHWYHLDTCFCPLPDGHALAYDRAFSARSVAALSDTFGKNIFWVSEQDANDFACNAVVIGSTVILHKASDRLKQTLAQRGFEVVESEMSEFLKAGGSCKCLTLEI